MHNPMLFLSVLLLNILRDIAMQGPNEPILLVQVIKSPMLYEVSGVLLFLLPQLTITPPLTLAKPITPTWSEFTQLV